MAALIATGDAARFVSVDVIAGHAQSATYPGPVGVQAIDLQEWMTPPNDFQGLNVAGVKGLTIGVGDRNKATSGGEGVIYPPDVIGVGHPLSSS